MANKTAKVGGAGLSIDMSSMSNWGKALRKQEPEFNRRLRRQLRAAGEVVRSEALRRASWSSTLPHTIQPVRTSKFEVSISAVPGNHGAGRIPILFELGNSVRRHGYVNRGATTFRHPVFNSTGAASFPAGDGSFYQQRMNASAPSNSGRRRHGRGVGWADEKTRPFMAPSLAARRAEVIDIIDRATVETIQAIKAK